MGKKKKKNEFTEVLLELPITVGIKVPLNLPKDEYEKFVERTITKGKYSVYLSPEDMRDYGHNVVEKIENNSSIVSALKEELLEELEEGSFKDLTVEQMVGGA